MGGYEAGAIRLGYAASHREESAAESAEEETEERSNAEAEAAARHKPYS